MAKRDVKLSKDETYLILEVLPDDHKWSKKLITGLTQLEELKTKVFVLSGVDTKEIEDVIQLFGSWGNKKREKLVSKLKNACRIVRTSSAKQKGRKWQQDVCGAINLALIKKGGKDFYVKGEDGLIMSRAMGSQGTDIILTGEAKEKFNYAVECKCTENLNVADAVRQASANLGGYENWLLLWKKKSMDEPVAILSMQHFFELIKELEQLKAKESK